MACEKEVLKIAIASDLHAHSSNDEDKAPSFLDMTTSRFLRNQHPIEGLKHFIDDKNLTADLLLCPGDLTNKAKPEPLDYAWQGIREIGSALGVDLIAATAGNHDLDSRYKYNNYDAKGMLQHVKPAFPLPNGDKHVINHYWAKNYVIKSEDCYRLILLNSSAFHGGAEEEWKHGRISKYTLQSLKDDLESGSKRSRYLANIMLCHHHPIRHAELEISDYDEMERGRDLLDCLGEYGTWLVVHGHKHFPKIHYGPGSASAPIVFSAGSFSAIPYPEIQGVARNQFYILELRLDDMNQYGLVGQGRAWDYIHGAGWSEAGPQSGIPARFGFGCRDHPFSLASSVASFVSQKGTKVEWGEVLRKFPKLQYVLPEDKTKIEEELEQHHQLIVVKHRGEFAEIGRRPEV